MWGISHPHHLMLGIKRSRTGQRGGVMVDAGSINFTSGRGVELFQRWQRRWFGLLCFVSGFVLTHESACID